MVLLKHQIHKPPTYQLLFELLNLSPRFVIHERQYHSSSGEAFKIMIVQGAMSETTLGLQDVFGEQND
jgi:hypothetical protein